MAYDDAALQAHALQSQEMLRLAEADEASRGITATVTRGRKEGLDADVFNLTLSNTRTVVKLTIDSEGELRCLFTAIEVVATMLGGTFTAPEIPAEPLLI